MVDCKNIKKSDEGKGTHITNIDFIWSGDIIFQINLVTQVHFRSTDLNKIEKIVSYQKQTKTYLRKYHVTKYYQPETTTDVVEE
jgi:hypothetical protein